MYGATDSGAAENRRIEELANYYDETDLGDTAWNESAVEVEHPELEQVSIRLPKDDLDLLKKRASRLGVGYTTLLRMVVREHLRSAPPR